jgi:16S rRNA (guanine966-N2)-methyltransferase
MNRHESSGEHANQIRDHRRPVAQPTVAVPDLPGLRPTPDRVRETLFNWLAPALPGARCLDLFAGSGALGIEALSRGAAEVVFVERHPLAIRALRENLARLNGAGARVEPAEALAWLRQPGTPFEIALLDPPFGEGLLEPVCAAARTGRLVGGNRLDISGSGSGGRPAVVIAGAVDPAPGKNRRGGGLSAGAARKSGFRRRF